MIGPDESLEGILHFPVRWDALSKASQLKTVTGLQWGVEYHAHSDRFRVVLGSDEISHVKVTTGLSTPGSTLPPVGEHRCDPV